MAPEVREVKGYQPVGDKLPEFFPPLVRNFFKGVLNGLYADVPRDQIAAMVSDQFASIRPLTSLKPEEERQVVDFMVHGYKEVFSRPEWEAIAGNVAHSPATGNAADGMFSSEYSVLYTGSILGKPLTPSEKEELLTDAAAFTKLHISYRSPDRGFGESGLLEYGTRHLYEGKSQFNYGFTEDSFRDLLSTVRKAQGKTQTDRLKGLDIGGSNGLGAHDAEELDENLDMTNLTTRPEIGSWPLRGGHVLVPAERMPEDFRERFDVIVSNMAFRYMLYPEIGLRNAISALSTGGIMFIHFSTYDSPLDEDELGERGRKQFGLMEEMEKEGIIKFIPPPDDQNDAYDIWKKNKNDPDFWLPRGLVHLQKTKSIVAS